MPAGFDRGVGVHCGRHSRPYVTSRKTHQPIAIEIGDRRPLWLRLRRVKVSQEIIFLLSTIMVLETRLGPFTEKRKTDEVGGFLPLSAFDSNNR